MILRTGFDSMHPSRIYDLIEWKHRGPVLYSYISLEKKALKTARYKPISHSNPLKMHTQTSTQVSVQDGR
jgi:hypothetical protein